MIFVPVVKPNVRLKTVYSSSIPVDGIELEEVIALPYCQFLGLLPCQSPNCFIVSRLLLPVSSFSLQTSSPLPIKAL